MGRDGFESEYVSPSTTAPSGESSLNDGVSVFQDTKVGLSKREYVSPSTTAFSGESSSEYEEGKPKRIIIRAKVTHGASQPQD